MPATATPTPDPGPATRWHVLAAACAWLLPGLGHAVLGQRTRGIILGVTILSLWTLGLLVGGIACIETRSPQGQLRVPFLGQMLLAPSIAVAWYHHDLRDRVGQELTETRADTNLPPEVAALPLPNDPEPFYEPSYAHLNEQGALFTALAGMLNLLAIIDVLYRDPKTVARQAGRAAAAVTPHPPPPTPTEDAPATEDTRVVSVWVPAALAWRPFLDPIHLERYWMLLLVPLVLAITIVYKTIKLDDLSRLPREVVKLSVQIIAFMCLAAALLWLVVELA